MALKWVNGMFLGEYQHKVDTKYRLILPTKFRDALGSRFVITRGLDTCLFVYSQAEWRRLHDKVAALPLTDEAVRRFVRFFFGGAADCEPDGQGRVMLPAHLRAYAGISKEVVSIGVASRVEIWSAENFAAYNACTSGGLDAGIAEKMAGLGI